MFKLHAELSQRIYLVQVKRQLERKIFSSICYTDFKSNPIVRSLKNKASLFNQPIDNFIRNKFNKSN